ncbi:zinc ribbon domain-containing protein [Propioniciclava coleopterorum]|uniref:zinc ribbon domain-containing protein n=1 Tax=Propioniciclava coleopterorum TaxID=2714937 RepID=UPI003D72E4EA
MIRCKGAPAPGRARAADRALNVRSGAIATEAAQPADDAARPACAPPQGLLHCGTCGSRMLLDFATNPRGTTYAYFICSGRAAKKTTCTRRSVPVQAAERLVADSYRDITISETDYRHLAAEVDAAFEEQSAGRDREFANFTANRGRLEAESDKLLAAHFDDAIDLPTLKRHQDRIRTGLAVNPPGVSGGSEPWEGKVWSHAREHIEEVSA